VRLGGDRERAGAFPLDVEAQFEDLSLHAIEIPAAQCFQVSEFIGPAAQPTRLASMTVIRAPG
jgi:hypothetical protein